MRTSRNAIRVAQYFWLSDFEDPQTHAVIVDARLLSQLAALHYRIGRDFTILVAFVDIATLPKLECAHGSAHFLGEAIDITIAQTYWRELVARASELPGVRVIHEATYLHLEVDHVTTRA